MPSKIVLSVIGGLAAVTLLAGSTPAFAEESVAELKQQIDALQKRVEELESSQGQQEPDDAWGFFNRRSSGAWDPFDEMRRMQEEMDRMFQNSFNTRGFSQPGGAFSNSMTFDYDFDLKEKEHEYEIIFDMQGLDQEKVDIDINEHSITVKGERSSKETEENQNSYFSAQSYGSFMKTIPLPIDADTSKMKTQKEGDSLVITIPKKLS